MTPLSGSGKFFIKKNSPKYYLAENIRQNGTSQSVSRCKNVRKVGRGPGMSLLGFPRTLQGVQIIGPKFEVSNLLKNMGKSLCPNSSLLDVVVPFIDFALTVHNGSEWYKSACNIYL